MRSSPGGGLSGPGGGLSGPPGEPSSPRGRSGSGLVQVLGLVWSRRSWLGRSSLGRGGSQV